MRAGKDRAAAAADGEVVQPEVDPVERVGRQVLDAREALDRLDQDAGRGTAAYEAEKLVDIPRASDHGEEQSASTSGNRGLHFAGRVRPETVHTAPRLDAGQRSHGREIRRGSRPDLRVEAKLPHVFAERFPIHEERADAAVDQCADAVDVVIEHDQLDRRRRYRGARRHVRVAHATIDEPNGTVKRLDAATSTRLINPSVRSMSRPGRRSTGWVPPANRRLRYTSGNSRHWK